MFRTICKVAVVSACTVGFLSATPHALHVFPVPHSTLISGILWKGPQIAYPGSGVKGDTYPMTWAADGNIYTSAGDPNWGLKPDGLDVEKFSGQPTDYVISKVNEMYGFSGGGGAGAKPSGMISVDGVLYLGFALNCIPGGECLAPPNGHTASQRQCSGQIVYSADSGKTWNPPLNTITKPMFPGWKFGGPSFIQFGQDNANARDTFVYAVSGEQWDNGDNMRLGRVGKNHIMNVAAWEWVSGFTANNQPLWSHNLDSSKVLLSDPDWISGNIDVVYIKEIKRYLFSHWHLNTDFCSNCGGQLVIYDAPEPWGPYTVAAYDSAWEATWMNAYGPHIPLKWFDGAALSGWLQFSGCWTSSTEYRSHVRPFQLLLADSTYPPVADTLVLNQEAATFYGTWVHAQGRPFGDYNDDVRWTSADRDSFVLSFTGTGIDLIDELGPDHGSLDLYIDGVFQSTVALKSPTATRVPQMTVWGIRNLSYGSHKFKGISRPAAPYLYGVVDAFRVIVDTVHATGAVISPVSARAQSSARIIMSPASICIVPAMGEKLSGIHAFDLFGKRLPITEAISGSSTVFSRNKFPAGLFILDIQYSNGKHERIVVNNSSKGTR